MWWMMNFMSAVLIFAATCERGGADTRAGREGWRMEKEDQSPRDLLCTLKVHHLLSQYDKRQEQGRSSGWQDKDIF